MILLTRFPARFDLNFEQLLVTHGRVQIGLEAFSRDFQFSRRTVIDFVERDVQIVERRRIFRTGEVVLQWIVGEVRCRLVMSGGERMAKVRLRTGLEVVAYVVGTEPIVQRALGRVGEHLVGLADLGELLLGVDIVAVLVRMMFECVLFVGAFDFIVRRPSTYAEYRVVIFVAHSRARLTAKESCAVLFSRHQVGDEAKAREKPLFSH